ncbi:hypothetical protein HQ584_05070 [Patescibacteria group bacterium]|nr:hypothetical protein [Patescibacteria group bacterium]
MKLTITEPKSLAAPEKIMEFGKALQKHKKELAKFEKEFRARAGKYMEENGENKLENDEVLIIKPRNSETYKHDAVVVSKTLGVEAFEYLAVDNSKLNKELKKYSFNKRPKFSPEQIQKLEADSIKITRKGSIRITIK